jgi:hypothetical protein
VYPLRTRVTGRLLRIYSRNKNSAPYISQHWFRTNAKLVIHSLSDLDESVLSSLQPNDSLYCYSHVLEEFLNNYSLHLPDCTLISGSTDTNFTDVAKIKLGNIKKLYLQNSQISDGQRILTLPIGLEDYHLGLNGLKTHVKKRVAWDEKSSKILIGPFSYTHSIRKWLLQASANRVDFNVVEGTLTPGRYSRLSSKHRYIVCPRGKGIDTHRVWETLYRGSLPIVIRDNWSESLKSQGVPLIIIDSWQELLDSPVTCVDYPDPPNPQTIPIIWSSFWKKEFASGNT